VGVGTVVAQPLPMVCGHFMHGLSQNEVGVSDHYLDQVGDRLVFWDEAELDDVCHNIEVARDLFFFDKVRRELFKDTHVALRFRHTGEGARDDDLFRVVVQVLVPLDLRDDVIRLGLVDRVFNSLRHC